MLWRQKVIQGGLRVARHIIKKEDLYKTTVDSPSSCKKTDLEEHEDAYINHDSVGSLNDFDATALYIFVMIVGSIFRDRLIIYIAATIIWWGHLNRKKIRKKQWDKMQEEKKNGGYKK